MIYIFLAALSGACAVSQSALAKFVSQNGSCKSPIRFNTAKIGAAALLFALLSLTNLHFHKETALFAAVYSTAMFCSNLFGYYALSRGAMSLTSLLVSYNVVIPCLHGILFLGEKMNMLQIVGFFLLLVSMLLILKPSGKITIDKKWILFIAITFVSNGICSIVQKLHQTSYPGEFCNEFMLYSLCICFIFFALFSLFSKTPKNSGTAKFSLPAGILMGLANYITLLLSAKVNSTVLFPAVSIFTVILNVTASRIIFKDKLSATQLVGIALGAASVLMIK